MEEVFASMPVDTQGLMADSMQLVRQQVKDLEAALAAQHKALKPLTAALAALKPCLDNYWKYDYTTHIDTYTSSLAAAPDPSLSVCYVCQGCGGGGPCQGSARDGRPAGLPEHPPRGVAQAAPTRAEGRAGGRAQDIAGDGRALQEA